MTQPKRKSGKSMEIYDPRICDREFLLSNGALWHSRESGLVFFETESYGHFVDSDRILQLLDFLCDQTASSLITLVVDPCKNSDPPLFLEQSTLQDRILKGEFSSSKLVDACSFYNSNGDYGTWNFSGIRALGSTAMASQRLPDIVTEIENVVFHLEIDLDGMLIGFLQPQTSLDAAVQGLREL